MTGSPGLPEDIAGREAEAAEIPAAVTPVTVVIAAMAIDHLPVTTAGHYAY
jgi:hypothetical protein